MESLQQDYGGKGGPPVIGIAMMPVRRFIDAEEGLR
jgi:hypothetical protein